MQGSSSSASAQRSFDRRAFVLTLGAGLLGFASGCSGTAAKADAPTQTPLARELYPDELIPSDLDVVVRIDVGEAKAALGERAGSAEAMLAGDALFASALARASVVTLAIRMRHIAEGDRVAVLEFPEGKPALEAAEIVADGFEESASTHPKARVFVRPADVGRAGTQAIVLIEGVFAAFVTPAEVDAVLRVLARGPDEFRGRPLASGVVSVDMRPGRLPARYETRYKHVAKLVASVTRVKAKLTFADDALLFDCNFFTNGEDAAVDLRQFFDALAENAPDTAVGRVVESVQRNAVGTVLHLRARVPLEMVALLWTAAENADAADKPQAEGDSVR